VYNVSLRSDFLVDFELICKFGHQDRVIAGCSLLKLKLDTHRQKCAEHVFTSLLKIMGPQHIKTGFDRSVLMFEMRCERITNVLSYIGLQSGYTLGHVYPSS
jgi:hypothetical protein